MDILVVEDDHMLAEEICRGLRQEGWLAEWTKDAVSAKLSTLNHAYDAILLDLGLPGASGLSFLKGLRAGYATTPVLIVTARHKLSDRIAGLDAGADDYIVKPFQIDELCARVRAVVRRTQGRVSPLLLRRSSEPVRSCSAKVGPPGFTIAPWIARGEVREGGKYADRRSDGFDQPV
jgi:two-component system OmpR family response regulator